MTFPTSFPFTFPGGGGDFVPLTGFESIEGTVLAWLGDYCAEGQSLLLPQFRQPLIEALVCALSTGSQELEDAVWGTLTERWLDNGAGVQLDRIGDLVGLPRTGWLDETYREVLRAQVLVLRSSSTWPDLFGVLLALGLTLTLVTHEEHYPAAMLVVLAEVPSIDGDVVFGLLDASRGAGIRLVLEVPMSALEDAFTFADADDPTADASRGWAEDDGLTGGVLAADYASSEGV